MLRLKAPRKGKTPYFAVRGTYLGVHVDRSTKIAERRIAKRVLDRIKDEIERGVFTDKPQPTFLSAAVAYMKAGGERRFVGPLLHHFRETPLPDIDQAAIDKAAAALYPDASPATLNRQVYSPVSAILKRAGVQFEVKRPKGWRGSKRTFWLWPEQAFRIFAAADAIDAEFGIFLRFLCYTGLRLNEACGLMVDDVRLSESFAYLPDSKNGDPRPIFLPPVIVSHLASHPRGMERPGKAVFRFRKNGRIYELLADVLEAANVELPDGVSFHVFCHTYGTWMRRYGGLDVQGLVETRRWRDPASAARYAHVDVSEAARKALLLPTERGESGENPEAGEKPNEIRSA